MALSIQSISTECPGCGGTGTEDYTVTEGGLPVPGTRDCTMCEGDLRISSAALHVDLITLFNDINGKIDDVVEKVNEIKAVVDLL